MFEVEIAIRKDGKLVRTEIKTVQVYTHKAAWAWANNKGHMPLSTRMVK